MSHWNDFIMAFIEDGLYHPHHPLALFPQWILVPEAVKVFVTRTCLPRATLNHSPAPQFSGGGQQLSQACVWDTKKAVSTCGLVLSISYSKACCQTPLWMERWEWANEAMLILSKTDKNWTTVGWCHKRFAAKLGTDNFLWLQTKATLQWLKWGARNRNIWAYFMML